MTKDCKEYIVEKDNILVLGQGCLIDGILIEGNLTPVRYVLTDNGWYVLECNGTRMLPAIETTGGFWFYKADKTTVVKTGEGESGHAVLPTDWDYEKVEVRGW